MKRLGCLRLHGFLLVVGCIVAQTSADDSYGQQPTSSAAAGSAVGREPPYRQRTTTNVDQRDDKGDGSFVRVDSRITGNEERATTANDYPGVQYCDNNSRCPDVHRELTYATDFSTVHDDVTDSDVTETSLRQSGDRGRQDAAVTGRLQRARTDGDDQAACLACRRKLMATLNPRDDDEEEFWNYLASSWSDADTPNSEEYVDDSDSFYGPLTTDTELPAKGSASNRQKANKDDSNGVQDDDEMPNYKHVGDDGAGSFEIMEDSSKNKHPDDIFDYLFQEENKKPASEKDSDGDGIPDSIDDDDDNDGIPDYLDDDDDGDGILDWLEDDYQPEEQKTEEEPAQPSETVEEKDTDGDGIPDSIDDDDDNDGIPDYLDDDDDGDGILDWLEDDYYQPEEGKVEEETSEPIEAAGEKDTDGDGIPDSIDEDDDNDGIPDYLDDDDDGDGILDWLEDDYIAPQEAEDKYSEETGDDLATRETEHDEQGSPHASDRGDEATDWLEQMFAQVPEESIDHVQSASDEPKLSSQKDSDGDGIPDSIDDDDDNDGIPDYLDDDDDGDGILDWLEEDYDPEEEKAKKKKVPTATLR